jgi:hypothetical protein
MTRLDCCVSAYACVGVCMSTLARLPAAPSGRSVAAAPPPCAPPSFRTARASANTEQTPQWSRPAQPGPPGRPRGGGKLLGVAASSADLLIELPRGAAALHAEVSLPSVTRALVRARHLDAERSGGVAAMQSLQTLVDVCNEVVNEEALPSPRRKFEMHCDVIVPYLSAFTAIFYSDHRSVAPYSVHML